MGALVRFAHITAGNTFTTAEIHPAVVEALGCTPEHYTLASLRYDLSKIRAKGLVAKLPNSRRYQLLPQGYSICLVFLKLFERVYAPLTAGLLSPIKQTSGFKPKGDRNLTGSISALSMISIPSFAPSASRPHDNDAKREQNPHYTRYNGLIRLRGSRVPSDLLKRSGGRPHTNG